jgi:hypothetical protein
MFSMPASVLEAFIYTARRNDYVAGAIYGTQAVCTLHHFRGHHADGICFAQPGIVTAGSESNESGMQSVRCDPARLRAVLPTVRAGPLIHIL